VYTPPYNRIENRAELLAFMRANDFPVLVTGTGGALHATHLPIVIHDRGDRIAFDMHMAKTNPQWKEFFDDEVLVIFSGPHAYVSPRWYEEQERVPTWNYAAVHAYGRPRLISAPEDKLKNQRQLVAQLDPEWLPKFDALSPQYIEKMLDGIVNFEIDVTRIDARWKLSQNRGRREMELIAARLEKSDDTMVRALAALHRQHLPED
jgi:transcriptional regulator